MAPPDSGCISGSHLQMSQVTVAHSQPWPHTLICKMRVFWLFKTLTLSSLMQEAIVTLGFALGVGFKEWVNSAVTRHRGETALTIHSLAPKTELLKINQSVHLCHSHLWAGMSLVGAPFCQPACLTDLFTEGTRRLTENISGGPFCLYCYPRK